MSESEYYEVSSFQNHKSNLGHSRARTSTEGGMNLYEGFRYVFDIETDHHDTNRRKNSLSSDEMTTIIPYLCVLKANWIVAVHCQEIGRNGLRILSPIFLSCLEVMDDVVHGGIVAAHGSKEFD